MANSYKTEWNFSLLYNDENDPKIESDIAEVLKNSYLFVDKWKNREDYLCNENILKEALDEYEKWARFYGCCSSQSYYFWLRLSVDQNNGNLKAKYNKINDISTKIRNDISFFELNLSKINKNTQQLFLNSELLNDYKNYLTNIFNNAKYWLSLKEENIITLKNKTSFENWANLMDELLSKEERTIFTGEMFESKNFSSIIGEITNKNKNIRDSAFEAINDILLKNSHIAEIEFNSILEDHRINKKIRGFERFDSQRHLSDNISSNIVDSLINSVSSNFNISREFYEIKAKLFGVEKLKYNERSLEYGQINKNYNYNESINLIKETFKSIDFDFYNILLELLDGHIDVFPKKGKSDGAFCATGSIENPVYIMLNHSNKLNDVLTIAHECGHAINDYLMINKQNSLNFGNSLAIAEVASTFFEDFVLEKMLEKADDELRLTIMMMKLNGDISTIFRQIAFYKFESEIHLNASENGYLSKKDIGFIFQKHMKDYMGDSIDHSSGTENWWIYVSHFRNPFYVYSYASGLLISKAMQNNLKKDTNFIFKIKKFLSAGTSKSPEDIFLDMGIDISNEKFWIDGISEISNLLENTKELAKKLGKI